jgi:hypothetical protein
MLQTVNKESFDQPFEFSPPTYGAGAQVNMWFLKCTLGNIKNGGTWLPMAHTEIIIVTFIPLSP